MEMKNIYVNALNVPRVKDDLHGIDELNDLLKMLRGTEGYTFLFNVEERDDYKSYVGLQSPLCNTVWLDFDAPPVSVIEAFKTYSELRAKCPGYVHLFFSGNKGFHLGLDIRLFEVTYPSEDLAKQIRSLVVLQHFSHLKTLDKGLYQANRLFRAIGSLHPKTNALKVRILDSEFSHLTTLAPEDVIPYLVNTYQASVLPELKEDYFDCAYPEEAPPVLFKPQSMGDDDVSSLDGSGQGDSDLSKDLSRAKKVSRGKKIIASCIATMSQHPTEGKRHDQSLRIIQDYKARGYTIDETQREMVRWAQLASYSPADLLRNIKDVYEKDYMYTCYDPFKQELCTVTCPLFRSLPKVRKEQTADYDPKADTGKKRPSEYDITSTFLADNEHKYRRYNNNLWEYKPEFGYFVPVTRELELRMKADLLNNYGVTDIRSAESIYKQFYSRVKSFTSSEEEGFAQGSTPRFVIAFRDYVVTADKRGNDYTFTKHQKSPDIFCTNHLPYDFAEIEQITANLGYIFDLSSPTWEAQWEERTVVLKTYGDKLKRLEQILTNLFYDDTDRHQKENALFELIGAALFPIYPRLFFAVGEPKTGKSSVCTLVEHVIGKKNVSSCPPSRLRSREETVLMLGKRVNIDSDIDTSRKVNEDTIKKILDQSVVTANPKYRDEFTMTLPPIHLFAGNSMFQLEEKNVEAHRRRWTLLRFNHVIDGEFVNATEWIESIKDLMPLIVARGFYALTKLLERGGKYTVPASSAVIFDALKQVTDPFEAFMIELKNNEIPGVKLSDRGKIKRSDLWKSFDDWQSSVGISRDARYGKMGIFNKIRGFREVALKQDKYNKCGPILGNQSGIGALFEEVNSEGIFYFKGVEKTTENLG